MGNTLSSSMIHNYETEPPPFGSGNLDIVIGPMFAGKTKFIIDKYNELLKDYKKEDIAVINHTSDIRYSTDPNKLFSHDKEYIPCISTDQLMNIRCKLKFNPFIFLINEANFFPDLIEFVENEVDKNGSYIILAGLNGDYKRKPFGNLLSLISYADNVKYLKATCSICKNNKALFSKRTGSDSQDQKLIGTDIYKPVCRICYFETE